MLRAITVITIQQVLSTSYPNRSAGLTFTFCNHFECENAWEDFTDTGKIVLPKSLYVRNQNNQLIPLGTAVGQQASVVNIGGFSSAVPLLLRGDLVTISSGYKYFTNTGVEIKDLNLLYKGFISKVTSKKPLTIECEDNMWKLKQLPCPIKTFAAGTALEDILTAVIPSNTGFTVNASTKTTFGQFTCGNETVCEMLARLRKDFHFESYFREQELRCGSVVYIESETVTNTFTFQRDIIDPDNLDYRRKDDIVLSAVARNTIQVETGKFTKSGTAKTKRTRLEVLVTFQSNGTITQFVKQKGFDYPPNTGGERRDLIYPGATTIDQLAVLAILELKKYYYDGYKGYFTTFIIPYVKMGDNVVLINPILPEQNGTYKVKKVEYSGGAESEGMRQKIHLDFRVGGSGTLQLTPAQTTALQQMGMTINDL